ncbi:MAG: hypothetical protein ACRCXK_06805 [Wohlfahrtiimonas sp.]
MSKHLKLLLIIIIHSLFSFFVHAEPIWKEYITIADEFWEEDKISDEMRTSSIYVPFFTPLKPRQCRYQSLASDSQYKKMEDELIKNPDLISAWNQQNEYLKNIDFLSRKDVNMGSKRLEKKFIEVFESTKGEFYKYDWLMATPYSNIEFKLSFTYKYGDFYTGRLCRPHDCDVYAATFVWNPKTKELVTQLWTHFQAYDYLSNTPPSQEALEALACDELRKVIK